MESSRDLCSLTRIENIFDIFIIFRRLTARLRPDRHVTSMCMYRGVVGQTHAVMLVCRARSYIGAGSSMQAQGDRSRIAYLATGWKPALHAVLQAKRRVTDERVRAGLNLAPASAGAARSR